MGIRTVAYIFELHLILLLLIVNRPGEVRHVFEDDQSTQELSLIIQQWFANSVKKQPAAVLSTVHSYAVAVEGFLLSQKFENWDVVKWYLRGEVFIIQHEFRQKVTSLFVRVVCAVLDPRINQLDRRFIWKTEALIFPTSVCREVHAV